MVPLKDRLEIELCVHKLQVITRHNNNIRSNHIFFFWGAHASRKLIKVSIAIISSPLKGALENQQIMMINSIYLFFHATSSLRRYRWPDGCGSGGASSVEVGEHPMEELGDSARNGYACAQIAETDSGKFVGSMGLNR